ncbi:glycoside hydrolase family 6 protein [Kutzneria sp. 744]|uniref:glycoside hydrolase family 6 protein n=1 Tax=Kutzneria sp. (strain 744) TaxID=345341 RepID=UPI0003EEAE4C|nr:glycoside hydrolase family 6 protein [Kutzneria sp. 744]EWM10593.1 endoglucanase [Kutzneria sp. 744]
MRWAILSATLLTLAGGVPAHAATAGFYVNPDSAPAAWVRANPGDSRASTIQASIADRPIARWFGDDANIGATVGSYVGAAASHNQLPVLVAYNLPGRDVCGGESSGGASGVGAYETWISGFAAGIGTKPAVVVIEPDGLADIGCMTSSSDIADRLTMLAFAARMFHEKASNASAYLDAGNAGWVAADTMASRLKSADVSDIRGFALNVSNFYTTASSITYANAVNAALGHVAGFVIDTSRNGNGSNGQWCNPSGRKLGTPPQNGGGADMLLWIKTPGVSDGKCGVAPTVAAGQFSPDLAVRLINGT